MNTLTEDIVKGAEVYREAQKTRKLTTAQLPVFRECSNLLYLVMKEMYHAPRKMTKPMDEAVACATELCRSVAMANEVKGEERVEMCSIALANANTLNVIITSLGHLGAVPKQTGKDFKARIGRVTAQVIGWREFATRQGQAVLTKGGKA